MDQDRKEDLRRQFGTMWKMASTGIDTLREVVVRSSQSGRLRVDLALLQREKRDLLEALGLEALRLVDAGEMDPPASLGELCARVRELSERLRLDEVKAHDNAFGAPRGYEAEAALVVEPEADELPEELDEHAEVARDRPRRRRGAAR